MHVVPDWSAKFAEEREAVMALSASEVLAAIAKLAADTASLVMRAALLYERAIQLGIDREVPLPREFVRNVKLILARQLLPELYAACLSNLTLLRYASKLPLIDQAKIASNEPIKVMDLSGDHRMVPALSLTAEEIRQVFDGAVIADDSTQVSRRRRAIEKEAVRASIDDAANPIRVDKRGRRLVVNGVELTLSQLLHYVQELA